jgi:hypothetical protein
MIFSSNDLVSKITCEKVYSKTDEKKNCPKTEKSVNYVMKFSPSKTFFPKN